MIMTTDFLSNWKTHVYSCLLLASEVYIHAYFCLWNIYSCLFLASEIYIYMKSEDGKEEEYVPSGWKFPFTIEICFGFWWWWKSISGILIYIQLFVYWIWRWQRRRKRSKWLQLVYIERWNCIALIKDWRCNSSMRLDILTTLIIFVEVDSFTNSRTIDKKLVYYFF